MAVRSLGCCIRGCASVVTVAVELEVQRLLLALAHTHAELSVTVPLTLEIVHESPRQRRGASVAAELPEQCQWQPSRGCCNVITGRVMILGVL